MGPAHPQLEKPQVIQKAWMPKQAQPISTSNSVPALSKVIGDQSEIWQTTNTKNKQVKQSSKASLNKNLNFMFSILGKFHVLRDLDGDSSASEKELQETNDCILHQIPGLTLKSSNSDEYTGGRCPTFSHSL
eukprot:TRINITY_DN30774_c1_g1_i1.p1 TRINITY_DN30774_c1_g1~~TRINITY_DN30774_c1_g1_i1.p1  ORF type:complete len:132 (-),score=22.36 TRINITY_DN30774_c1_g1_i1:361-756(-)